MRHGRWLILVLPSLAAATPPLRAQSPIDTLALRAHTYFLAHDLLEGRGTGTTGADLAALYITAQCRSLGLLPAGSTYTQRVPLEESTVDSGSRFIVKRGEREAAFNYPQHFTPNVGNRATLVGFRGRGVYVGTTDRLTSDRLEAVDLGGAVAVTLGPRATTEAVETLKRLGASGIVHLLVDENTYSLYRRSRGDSRFYHSDATIHSSFLPALPSVLASPELSYALVAGTALSRNEEMAPGPLDLEVEFEIMLRRRSFDAQNVACLLPGTDPATRDTIIAFTAHYDHLGIAAPDSSGDAIYNGFSDNAAGVAMLLAVARTMVQQTVTPMRHSVLFLFFVGEERGLLGSDYYVARPIWPLRRTRAVINLDAGAPAARPVTWRLAGVDSTGLGALAIGVAETRGWSVTTSPPTANSDYYPFIREGVPAVFVIPGPGPYEGLSADSSNALRYRWRYYHHPKDEWDIEFPFGGLSRYAEFAYLIARAVDGSAIAQ